MGSVCELNEIMHITCSAQCLVHSQHSIKRNLFIYKSMAFNQWFIEGFRGVYDPTKIECKIL